MAEILEFVIAGRDQFTGTFNKLQAALPSLKNMALGASAAVGALGAGLFAMAKTTAETQDQIGKFAGRIGISTEALSKYQAVAEFSGVTTASLNVGFQRMTRRISEAATGTGVAVKALEELNIPIERIKSLKPDQQFEMIGKALEGVSVQGDKVRLAMQFWDTEGVALLQTLKDGTAGLEAMKNEAVRFGTVISAQAAANSAEFNDSLTRMGMAFTGLKNSIAEEVIPTFTGLTNKLADFVADNRSRIIEFGRDVGEKLWEMAKKGALAAGILLDSWRGLQMIFEGLKIGVALFQAAVIDALTPLIVDLMPAFTNTWNNLQAVWKIVVISFHQLKQTIVLGLGVIVDKTIQTLEYLNFKGVFDDLIEGAGGFSTAISTAATEIGSDVAITQSEFMSLANTLLDSKDQARAFGVEMGLFSDSLRDVAAESIQSLQELVNEGLATDRIQSAITKMESLFAGLAAAGTGVVQAVGESAEDVLGTTEALTDESKKALEELKKARAEQILTDRGKLFAWFAEQQEMWKGNNDALFLAESIFRQSIAELDQKDLDEKQRSFEALKKMRTDQITTERGAILAWFEEQQEMWKGNEEALALVHAIYAEEIRQFDEELIEKKKEQIVNLGEFLKAWSEEQVPLFEDIGNLISGIFDRFASGVGMAVSAAIFESESLADNLAALFKNIGAFIISTLVKIGVQRFITAVMSDVIGKAEHVSRIAQLTGQTYAASFASTAAIPIVGPVIAPGVAAAATATMLAGQAMATASGAAAGAASGGAFGGAFADGGTVFAGQRILVGEEGPELFTPGRGGSIIPSGTGGGGLSVGNLVFHVLENATSGESLLRLDVNDWEDILVDRIYPAMRNLSNAGIMP